MQKRLACPAGSARDLDLSPGAQATRTGPNTSVARSLWSGHATGGGANARVWSDAARFLREWLRHPLDTAAIAPSGQALASLITREIDGSSGPVLELGPGTGVFTRALIGRGVAERDLTLVERSPSFAGLLKSRFPASLVLAIDASHLHRRLPSRRFGAAVCGLGLRNMAPSQVEDILQGSFAVLAPGASFHLFTYGGRCPVPDDVLNRLALTAEKVGSTLRNLPPASVYRLRQAGTGG